MTTGLAPTLAGFTAFLRNVVGINTAVLPDSNPVIAIAYNVALEIVNDQLALASSLMYQLAVYNLGADNVINYAQDVDPPVIYKDDLPFFAYMRKKWDTYGFQSGVVESTGDDGTSVSLVVQEAAKKFTLSDLQHLKTPWGRQYLAIAQKYGSNLWGIS